MNKPKNITVIKKISKVLKTTDKKLLKTDDFQKFETWDSLVHLEILSILEKSYGAKINKVKNLASLTSIKKIISKLDKIK
jgi:acyl carrier protein|tara:strand:+ start:552 stop:791 length:240 start_codon:yes stop_codon:yes gene_type:complete